MKWQNFRKTLMAAATVLFIFASATAAFAAPSRLPSSAAFAKTGSLQAALTRIEFAPGATSAVVSGNLAANKTVRYILRALANQMMGVTLSAPEGVRLSVMTASGRVLSPVTGGSTSFRGYLPRTGDYILEAAASNRAVSYSVNINIPARISFASGATSASLDGHVDPHQSLDYILRAQAGQILEVNVSPENSVQLIIYGVDGTVLRSGMGEGSSFRGELPVSEDYFVTVRAGDRAVSFTMNVIIPQRIRFEPGAISASLRGTSGSNRAQYYVLRALRNQTMQVTVTPNNPLQLIIYGADGTVLRSGMGEGTTFTGKLPSSQDYILALRAGAQPVTYTLKVIIQ